MRRAIAIVTVAVVTAACGPGAQERHDARWTKKLTPSELGVDHPHEGEPRVAKVRVYADEDFRAQHLRWREEIQEQLDDANQLLTPAVGLRLEAGDIQPWPGRSASRELPDLLAELEQHDDGKDVAWVIGMVSSLPIVAASFEQLGVARPLGRHFVLRGFADAEEREAFEQGLPTLSKARRDWLMDARRTHKLTALFVHELGHTLGAPHEVDGTWVMSDLYSARTSTMSEQSRRMMMLALERWLDQPHEAVGVMAARLLTFMDENPWGGWKEDEANQMRAQLAQLASQPTTGPDAATAGPGPVPAAALDQFRAAQLLARRGKFAEALAELEALIAAYPSAPELRIGVCEITLAKDGAAAPTAIAACDRALEVSPGDPRPIFSRIDALFAAKDVTAALALVPSAEALAATDRASWERIAAIYQSQGMITAAEGAIGHVGAEPDHPVLTWAARRRARYGLPQAGKGKVPVADEGAYVLAVREILDLVYASKFPAAEAKAKAAEKKWPNTPGVLGARCDLALRKGSPAAAVALCDKAIKLWPGAAWAQYLRGVMALQKGKTAPAIAALRAAIAAEPELAAAYRTLGKAFTMAEDQAAHDALDAEYQQRFGARLPD